MSREASQKYRKWHRKVGLCVDCPEKAVPGQIRCPYCNAKANELGKMYYQKNRERELERKTIRRQRRRESGRCPQCGAPREDETLISCANCRGRIHRGIGVGLHGTL
jgi:hypothetical protein